MHIPTYSADLAAGEAIKANASRLILHDPALPQANRHLFR
jgi:hypothetical protein